MRKIFHSLIKHHILTRHTVSNFPTSSSANIHCCVIMQDSKLKTANKPSMQLMRYLVHSPVSTGSVEWRWRQLSTRTSHFSFHLLRLKSGTFVRLHSRDGSNKEFVLTRSMDGNVPIQLDMNF